MEKHFIPFELALELEELKFDEECFTAFTPNHLGNKVANIFNIDKSEFKQLQRPFTLVNLPNSTWLKNSELDGVVSAPLWSQAFDWFRDEHNLESWLSSSNYTIYYNIKEVGEVELLATKGYLSYEEARLECLKKLIELCKS